VPRSASRILFYLAALTAWQFLHLWGPWPSYLVPGPVQWRIPSWRGSPTDVPDRDQRDDAAAPDRLLALARRRDVPRADARPRAWLDDTIGSLLLGLQTLPSICWLPLAVIWFGLNEKAIQFVVIMGAVLAITIHTSDGVKNIPPIYVRAGRNLGARGFRLLGSVVLRRHSPPSSPAPSSAGPSRGAR